MNTPHTRLRNRQGRCQAAPLSAAERAANESDIFISVGKSGVVEPAVALAFAALEHGAIVVEINPEATPLTPLAAHVLTGPSGAALPDLVKALWPEGKRAA